MAQIGPAFLGGLVWRRGTARGAIAGMSAGSLAWFYLLLLPSLKPQGALVGLPRHTGRSAIAWLSPAALTGFAPIALVGGVVLSLASTSRAFVVSSLTRKPTRARTHAGDRVRRRSRAASRRRSGCGAPRPPPGELEATVARYLGAERARRAFEPSCARAGSTTPPAGGDAQLIRHAEYLLSPAIGASTSRLVLSLLLRRRAMSGKSALKLLDDASAAIQSSRDQLQHALDHARQGITVFDTNLALTAWNREFADLFDLPPSMMRLGVGLDEIVRFNAARGAYGPGRFRRFRRRARGHPAL